MASFELIEIVCGDCCAGLWSPRSRGASRDRALSFAVLQLKAPSLPFARMGLS